MKLDNKNILIISPHPDDEVIGCGGLLEVAKHKNCKVFVFYMCIGKCRQLVTGSTNENTRLKELESVAKSCNFKYKVLFIGKEFMRLDTLAQKDLIDPIENIVEEFKPDIICIPSSKSYDQDHRAVYAACITALRPIPRKIRHFIPTVLVYEEPYTWTIKNTPTAPNFYLDMTGMEKKKTELLKLYKSQNRESPFSRSAENLMHYIGIRGAEVGLKSAEAYYLLRGAFE
jgi:LmbE family N-acetylglucosaminyl deacetylase